MKWYKFLINFALFASAIINAVSGINYITGDIYATQSRNEYDADFIYAFYGEGLKSLDIAYGVLVIIVAAFCVYTRFRLSGYKKDGPLCVCITYGASIVVPLIYNMSLLVVTPLGLSDVLTGRVIGTMIVSAAMLVLNYKYFNNRKDMFVN